MHQQVLNKCSLVRLMIAKWKKTCFSGTVSNGCNLHPLLENNHKTIIQGFSENKEVAKIASHSGACKRRQLLRNSITFARPVALGERWWLMSLSKPWQGQFASKRLEREREGSKSVLGKNWSDTLMNQQRLLCTELLFYTDSLYSWKLLDTKLKKKISPF